MSVRHDHARCIITDRQQSERAADLLSCSAHGAHEALRTIALFCRYACQIFRPARRGGCTCHAVSRGADTCLVNGQSGVQTPDEVRDDFGVGVGFKGFARCGKLRS